MTIPSNQTENQVQEQNARQNDREQNVAHIRKQLEHEKLARQQAEERAAKAEKENARTRNDSPDEDYSDEPYVDHRSLDKKFKRWESSIEEKIDKRAEEKARVLLDQEKRTTYLKQKSDFDKVMTPEMMQKLIEKDPDLAEAIVEMPDTFARQKLVYQAIKSIGLDRKEEPKQSIQKTIEANRQSAYYQPSGVGTAPYAAAGDYSPAGQKNAYAKLQELKSKMRI